MDKQKASIFTKLGAEIRRLRLSRGMTLEDMQDYGFSAQHFQKMESGKKEVNFYTIYRVAQAFEIKVSTLVKGID